MRNKDIAMSMFGFVAVLVAAWTGLAAATPLGTAFTYQGRLQDANSPANGVYDIQFKLYDSADLNAKQVGDTIDMNDLKISDGYFVVALDFGRDGSVADVFNGQALWLQIAVRPSELSDLHTLLWPRQEIKPTPYALYAAYGNKPAYRWTGPKGTEPRGTWLQFENPDGSWGTTENLQGPAGATGPALGIYDSLGKESSGSRAPGDAGRRTLFNLGNVGIGTTKPSVQLEIAGQIKITGGSPGAGKVLTSDGEGLASWQVVSWSPMGSSGQTLRHDGANWLANSLLYNNGASIGIGTTAPAPAAKLEVAGQVKITGGSPGLNKVLASDATGLASWQVFPWLPPGSSGQTLRHDGANWLANSVIYNNGTNVGIGMTSPAHRLDVAGGIGVQNYVQATTVGGLALRTYNTTTARLFVRDDGYVGIGTTSPGRKLDVAGTIRTSVNADGNWTTLNWGKRLEIPSGGAIQWLKGTGNTISRGIGFTTDDKMYFIRNTTDDATGTASYDVVIDGSGRVGIGTPAPVHKLDVVGGIGVENYIQAKTDTGLAVKNKNALTRLIVKDNGDVGIGTENPTARLHLAGGKMYLDSKGFGGPPVIDLAVGDTDTGLSSAGNGQLDLYSDNVPTMSIRSGKVGIGTPAPKGALHVERNDDVIFNGALAVRADTKPFDASVGSAVIIAGGSLNNLIFSYDYAASAPRSLVLQSPGGNVGIGTLNPADKLDVDGSIRVNGYIQAKANTGLAIKTNDGQTRLSVQDDGDIGIGTTAPTQKLDVDGTGRFRGIGPGGTIAVMTDGSGVLYKQSSSRRYKTNIRGLEDEPSAVLSLRPVKFQWKETGEQEIGLIAEEVEGVLNDLVVHDPEGKPEAVKYDKVSLYLLAVVKELKSENESLKRRLEAVERAMGPSLANIAKEVQ